MSKKALIVVDMLNDFIDETALWSHGSMKFPEFSGPLFTDLYELTMAAGNYHCFSPAVEKCKAFGQYRRNILPIS